MDHFQLEAIGKVHSPYKEKFAIPRQPGLVPSAIGHIELLNSANNIDSLRGIENFSHLWLIFVFHATKEQGWKPLVRPPRLGGNDKMGVFATRSTFRPNAIGMSVVKNEGIVITNNQVQLNISALDLLDGTPVLDIKPYIPYSDSIATAHAGYAQQIPDKTMSVHFSQEAINFICLYAHKYPNLQEFIAEVLTQDPRPAYKQQTEDNKHYGIRLYEFNIMWRLISASDIEVFEIQCESALSR